GPDSFRTSSIDPVGAPGTRYGATLAGVRGIQLLLLPSQSARCPADAGASGGPDAGKITMEFVVHPFAAERSVSDQSAPRDGRVEARPGNAERRDGEAAAPSRTRLRAGKPNCRPTCAGAARPGRGETRCCLVGGPGSDTPVAV